MDPEVTKFTEFPFSEDLQKNLVDAGYVTPTPIQARCIGPVIAGKDILGMAQTGTGKTAAFALPIIHRLSQGMELGALVLAPTRELVQQIVGVFRTLGQGTGIRVASVVGGVDMMLDWKALRSWPNVLVATPGRLLDHMEQKTVNLGTVEILVIDEADRMHDMGFIPQIRRILVAVPDNRQTLMFSATMPADVEQITRRSMHDPVKIQVGRAVPVERAEQELFHVSEEGKTELLRRLLRKETGRVLIFVRTKRGVDRLAPRLGRSGGPIARLHGDREQLDRDEAMAGFREGRYRILIATDIAARGLDVADIEHVINYDFPRSADDYVHRIGRTARLTARGRATSFVTGADRRTLAEVEKLIGSKITSTRVSGMAEGEAEEAPHGRAPGGGHGRRRRGPGGHSAPHGRREGPPSPPSPHGHKDATQAPHNRKEGPPAATPVAGQEAAPRGRRRRRGGRGRGQQPQGGQTPAAGHGSHASSGEAPTHAPKPHAPHHQAKPESHPPPSP